MDVRKMDKRLFLGLHEDFMRKLRVMSRLITILSVIFLFVVHIARVHLMLKSCVVEIDVQHIL